MVLMYKLQHHLHPRNRLEAMLSYSILSIAKVVTATILEHIVSVVWVLRNPMAKLLTNRQIIEQRGATEKLKNRPEENMEGV